MSNISIIGGGNGAHALAAHLSLTGNSVSIYPGKKFKSSISGIYETGKIFAKGAVSGEAEVTPINDLQELKNSKYLFIIVPAFAQEPLFYEIADYLANGQIIISMPGNMASFCYKRILNEKKINYDLIFSESFSILHGARVEKPGHVNVAGLKTCMPFSFLDGKREEGMKLLQKIIPAEVKLAKNTLTTLFQNLNGIVHPVPSLLNAGRIDSGNDDYYHYKDGISEHVANVLEVLEEERMKIANAYNAEPTPFLQATEEIYGIKYKSIRDFALNSPVHNAKHFAAASFDDRYISEDAAYILANWLTFAKLAKIDTPVLESSLLLISVAAKKDFLHIGRNFNVLGFHGKSFDEIYGPKLKSMGMDGKSFEEILKYTQGDKF